LSRFVALHHPYSIAFSEDGVKRGDRT
jgi:hypothetical protein